MVAQALASTRCYWATARRPELDFSTFPSPQVSTAMIKPYDTILCSHAVLENCGVSVSLDVEILYDIYHHS